MIQERWEHRSQEFEFKKVGRAFRPMLIAFILKEVSYLEIPDVPYLFEILFFRESKYERSYLPYLLFPIP